MKCKRFLSLKNATPLEIVQTFLKPVPLIANDNLP